jgi:hypothetical protein
MRGRATSLVRDSDGRLHISYHDEFSGILKYATCAVACDAATNWRVATVDDALGVGYFNSLVVDPTGRLHVSYRRSVGDLKYIE